MTCWKILGVERRFNGSKFVLCNFSEVNIIFNFEYFCSFRWSGEREQRQSWKCVGGKHGIYECLSWFFRLCHNIHAHKIKFFQLLSLVNRNEHLMKNIYRTKENLHESYFTSSWLCIGGGISKEIRDLSCEDFTFQVRTELHEMGDKCKKKRKSHMAWNVDGSASREQIRKI